MVINHLDKLFVTSDASTITSELEVQHPAAKLLVLAAAAQQQEVGDATNFVLSFAGELLAKAEGLLRDGLHPIEIADGYAKAGEAALAALEELVVPGSEVLDVRDAAAVARRIRAAISSKQYGYEDLLAPLIAEACVAVCPKNPANFNVDGVRVAKVPGGGVHDSAVVRGMVLKRGAEGVVTSVEDAKVAVFAQGIDTSSTETKGTVLIRSAEELEGYSASEERKVEEAVAAVAAAGARVVVSGSAIGEMAQHFIDKAGLMAIKIPSKFDLSRFCRATGARAPPRAPAQPPPAAPAPAPPVNLRALAHPSLASRLPSDPLPPGRPSPPRRAGATALVKLCVPTADQLGLARKLEVTEIGGTRVCVLSQGEGAGRVATVVLRGATEQALDDLERAVDDGVNAYRALCRDARALPAGGAPEVEVARRLQAAARLETGLEQYAVAAFAAALEVVPRTIAENAGLDAAEAVSALFAAHAGGQAAAGLDVETGLPRDLAEDGLLDLFTAKWWALKLAVEAATTVLRIDQIIMAKVAGGPRPRGGGGGDED